MTMEPYQAGCYLCGEPVEIGTAFKVISNLTNPIPSAITTIQTEHGPMCEPCASKLLWVVDAGSIGAMMAYAQ